MNKHIATFCNKKTCCPTLHYNEKENVFIIADDLGGEVELEHDELLMLGDTIEQIKNKKIDLNKGMNIGE